LIDERDLAFKRIKDDPDTLSKVGDV